MADDGLTRGERQEAARIKRIEAERLSRLATENERASRGVRGACPDPSSPDALPQLWDRAFRAMWRVACAPEDYGASEVQSTVAVFGAVRLAYGVGKEPAPTPDVTLDFKGFLGSVKPPGVAKGEVGDDAPPRKPSDPQP